MSTDTNNEVEFSSNQTMLTAQSDSVELYHALCNSAVNFSKAMDACKYYRKELDDKNNEVARLRELLNRAIEIADKSLDCLIPVFRGEHEEIETELKRLKAESKFAPAPEEPETSAHTDKCVGNVTEPAWRELGDDELICEEDERQDYLHGMVWRKCENSIGTLAGVWHTLKFRTRRPLPKQEEMPLEDEIETIWEHSEQIDSLTGHMAFKALAKSIRYLRDDIQKLKQK